MCSGKTSKSTTVVALMEDILGFALNPVEGIGATDKDNIYYIKKLDNSRSAINSYSLFLKATAPLEFDKTTTDKFLSRNSPQIN